MAVAPGLARVPGSMLMIYTFVGIENHRGGGQASREIPDREAVAPVELTTVVDYCRTAMAFLDHEEFRVLFLDKKNC